MRSIGGVFDFYVFSGPEPESITQQLTSLIGRTFMPPYFSLGFQLARWNYANLDDMKRVVESNLAAGILYTGIVFKLNHLFIINRYTIGCPVC